MKTLPAVLLALVGLLAPGHARAAEPPSAPVLRIEAGMHTTSIKRILADAAGRLVLTVSEDKTARLWDLPGGQLLRVLRPPLGEGSEGKLYAGALSPDGTLAAMGGFTGYEWDKSACVYLFDTATARLVRRLEGLPQAITGLAFSAQGRFLAGVDGDGELRVWETATGREVGRNADYPERTSYGVDWHGEDRVVTTCYDGHLRLYHLAAGATGARFTVRKKSTVQGGREPFAVRFSPDGRQIAVGFNDSTAVAVVDGSDLTFLFAPDTTGVNRGNLCSVAWTDDGATLAAGGSWQRGDDRPIRRWLESGRGRPRDTVAATSTITDLRPLPQAGILFGAADPAWGVLGAGGLRQLLGAPPLADYRNNQKGFRLSSDGATVAFSYVPFGRVPARFSVASRRLTWIEDDASPADLRAARVEGLKVTDWDSTTAPRLAGKPLALDHYENSRSLAIARDASGFLLGASYSLRSYTAKGKQRWRVPVPSIPWAVNLAAADRLAVAACGDGTIRWHRADTGRELLAFFPHPDRQRWVLWTPQGYYDCSPGAEGLIGWHVNRGKDQAADFFSASRFRNIYYRPDVVSRVLKTRDVTEALRQANRERGLPESEPERIAEVIARLAPPVVELETGGVFGAVTLPGDATEMEVRYRVRQTGAEAPGKVSVRFNGRLVDVAAPQPPAGPTAEVTVPLPAGMAGELSIFAEHHLATSEAALLRIAREPGKVVPRQPNLYVLAAGVADLKINDAADLDGDGKVTPAELDGSHLFKDGEVTFSDLEHAADDAQRVAEAFRAQEGKLYARVFTHILLDRRATAQALQAALREIAEKASPEDVAVVFFSGHGEVDPTLGFYLATYDVDPKAPAATALTGKELSVLLDGIRARTVLALDTCHSGGALGGAGRNRIVTGPGDLTGFVNALSSAEQGTVVLSSSQATEQSLEDAEKGGVFTHAFREGLAIKVTADADVVTCRGMQDWLTKRVPALVAALAKGAANAPQQTPACVIPKGVPDFPLAKLPPGAPVFSEPQPPTVSRPPTVPKPPTKPKPEPKPKLERYPVARATGKAGFVRSPYRPYHIIDVRGIAKGALVIDPSCERIFMNP